MVLAAIDTSHERTWFSTVMVLISTWFPIEAMVLQMRRGITKALNFSLMQDFLRTQDPPQRR